ncbi:MAG: hypothetical protein ACR2FJ_03365 [Qipengyuania sp.]
MEELVPIFGILMIIAIVWIVKHSKLEEKRIAAAAEGTAERAAQYASQVTRLEDRVRVLERIVTDKGYDVATQIEALRDRRAVEDKDSGVALDMKQRGAA